MVIAIFACSVAVALCIVLLRPGHKRDTYVHEQQNKMATKLRLIRGERCGKPLILLIDDDDEFFHRVVELFADDNNITFTRARTPEEGMEQKTRLRPDIVLVDLHIPRVDGDELITRLRGELPLCPVIPVTGFCLQDVPFADVIWDKNNVEGVLNEVRDRLISSGYTIQDGLGFVPARQ